jgi:uncharacterized protein (TIGR02145 family)
MRKDAMLRAAAVAILAVVLCSACDIASWLPPPAPPPLGSATDIDGNIYPTVVIGKQEWMAVNLKTTTYNDGTPIANVTDAASWASSGSPAYSWYDNDLASKDLYGALYNWYTLFYSDLRDKICPPGFGLFTHEGWGALSDALGGDTAGGALKEAGTSHWDAPNTGATNRSGFTALPGGERNSDGTFDSKGQIAWWWCADSDHFPLAASWFWDLQDTSTISLGSTSPWPHGYSIRCARDVTPN